MASAHKDDGPRLKATVDSSTEVFAGLVERVTFHNDDNGFCVLRVKARGKRDLITVVGHAATISAGEFIQGSGHESELYAPFARTNRQRLLCRVNS